MQERKSMQLKFCPYYTTLPQVVGYLKKFTKKTPKYHASQDGGVFKNFEKKIRKLPRNLELWGIIRTKISSLLRVPCNSKWSGTRKSEKVG